MASIKGFSRTIDYKKLFKSYQRNLDKEIKTLKKKIGVDYKWKDLIGKIPDLFDLLINILASELTPSIYKVRIILAISYLLAPVDVIPQEVYGLEGYTDDFSVLILILGSIKKNLPKKIIQNNWDRNYDIFEFIEESNSKIKLMLDKNILMEFQRTFSPD